MNQKILYLSILFLLSGCQSNQVKKEDNEKSFFIPFFEKIINYEDDEKLKQQKSLNEKEYMYLIMQGQLELNKGNNDKALEYFEKSLTIKYSDISYTVLQIYYKENNYLKTKEIAEKIYSTNKLVLNKHYENFLILLFQNKEIESGKLINSILNKKTLSYDFNSLNNNLNIYKDLAHIMSFVNKDPIYLKKYLKEEDFIMINFFFKYIEGNKKGEEPDAALNYIIENKTNLMHNFTIFKVAASESYSLSTFIEELNYLLEYVEDYEFEINILKKFNKFDEEQYEELKSKLIKKYASNYQFWYELSLIESNKQKALLYSIKAFNIINRDKILVQNKENIISNVVDLKIKNNEYNIKNFISYYDKKESIEIAISFTILKMIINNKFNYELILNNSNLIPDTNLNLLIAKNYYYLEKYDEALIYINKTEEEIPNNLETNLYKILVLGEKNKKIGLNEAEIYYNNNEVLDAKLVLLYMKYLNNIDIRKSLKEVDEIIKLNTNTNIKDFNDFPIYLSALFNYKLNNYSDAQKRFLTLNIKNNYTYLADYGKVLWKLNDRVKAKEYFKLSKSIFDSEYLKKTLKELNIKSEDL